jgi:selenide,water dikinase
VLRHLPPSSDPNLLVGTNTADDAGVYRLSAELALVQTVDFFAPVVDDPYWFGAIAAANALSDIYAMGGKPLTALNIVGFPASTLPLDVLADILRGGADKVREAGATLVGGHTVDDDEPKYGLAVTGLIDPRQIVTNAAGKPGDVLVLTKPLGSGIATTALKRDVGSDRLRDTVISTMATLNRDASEAMLEVGVNAATDVTGYGLLGHLHELTAGSGLAATISAESVPLLDEIMDLAGQDVVPSGTKRNLDGLKDHVTWDRSVPDPLRLVLADAQTSGGLLIAVPATAAERLIEALRLRGVMEVKIGNLHEGPAGTITVTR